MTADHNQVADVLDAEHALEPVPDIPRLRKCVEWVEEQAVRPEVDREWNQEFWVIGAELVDRECGTCYCVAGKVCHDAGLDARKLDQDNPMFGISSAAAGLLGLSRPDAQSLFEHDNTAADVRRIAESIAARVGERL